MGGISPTPRFCDCGAKNDHNHILNCKRGGYVNYRHNNVRDSVAEYLRLVTSDVKIEPLLTPIESPSFQQKGNNADKARLDISARREVCGAHLRRRFLMFASLMPSLYLTGQKHFPSYTASTRRRRKASI